MNPLHKKLRLKPNETILVINKPKGFDDAMAALPEGVKITTSKKVQAQHIYWFIKNTAELKTQQAEVLALLQPGIYLWLMHPKGSSGIQTDLTRDKGWESLQAIKTLAWVAYIAFDDTWTAVAVRIKTEADKKREANYTPEREIYKYADSKTKTITLHEALVKAFAKNKKAKEIFDALAFSHRREYVEWIITAKREETIANRVQGTIDMLLKGAKNPTMGKKV